MEDKTNQIRSILTSTFNSHNPVSDISAKLHSLSNSCCKLPYLGELCVSGVESGGRKGLVGFQQFEVHFGGMTVIKLILVSVVHHDTSREEVEVGKSVSVFGSVGAGGVTESVDGQLESELDVRFGVRLNVIGTVKKLEKLHVPGSVGTGGMSEGVESQLEAELDVKFRVKLNVTGTVTKLKELQNVDNPTSVLFGTSTSFTGQGHLHVSAVEIETIDSALHSLAYHRLKLAGTSSNEFSHRPS